jgi:glycerol-3-phosphate dehydrogenase
VRALYDDGARKMQDIDRDYALVLDKSFGVAPLLTVYGGKLTTFRRLAEDVLARLSHFFPLPQPWTAKAPLPGGDFVFDGGPALVARTRRRWPFLSQDHARRLVSTYGTRVEQVLGAPDGAEALGECFGEDLTAAEVRYLMSKEWALTAEDVLWRRSKLGLRFATAQTAALEAFMQRK